MSTPDVVRPAWTVDQLVDEIRQRRGSQFDPEVADLTAQLLESRASELLVAKIAVDLPANEG
jgi:HD-GYP domain-containing protein (c-di-GMP phosphodiesterase class II)